MISERTGVELFKCVLPVLMLLIKRLLIGTWFDSRLVNNLLMRPYMPGIMVSRALVESALYFLNYFMSDWLST